MLRSLFVWIAFAFCLLLVLAGLGWMSVAAVRLDEAEATARHRAALEENIQLALWRIDSTLAPLVARESARPHFVYRSMIPLDASYDRMMFLQPMDRAQASRWAPSPLLEVDDPLVRLHFQLDPDGRLTSPQVPIDAMLAYAVPRYVSESKLRDRADQLARFEPSINRATLLTALPAEPTRPVELVANLPLPAPAQTKGPQGGLSKASRGIEEFNRRNVAVWQQQASAMQQAEVQQRLSNLPAPPPTFAWGGTLMTPLWVEGELILARRIVLGDNDYVQGCLLDWPAIRCTALASIADLLPAADLEPFTAGGDQFEPRMLAALPARLVPGELPSADAERGLSPIRLALVAAWTGVLAAGLAIGGLLAGLMRLSARRAAFVSAVTHELRTPLTTFQMYCEMLAEGMVTEPGQQRHYLQTLRSEAARLTHLVENVLAYARLEKGRTDGRVEPMPLGELLEPMLARLADRAARAEMQLVVEIDDEAAAAPVRANPSAVEQIVLNLVDNACKYAAAADDRRIHLEGRLASGQAAVSIRDHGPGVPTTLRRRLFRPFTKSAQDAAHSAPGVGLGLALSRRIARALGGRLHWDQTCPDGAQFTLVLPLVDVR